MTTQTNELPNVPDEAFAVVARELASGSTDEALWTKAFAAQNGNEAATKANYIRLRVDQIAQESGRHAKVTPAPRGAGPWPRLFARHLDLWLEASLIVVLLVFVLSAIRPTTSPLTPSLLYVLFLMSFFLAWILDALVVTLFGNSLGKAIWGIRVRHGDGRQLTLGEVLNRNLSVCSQGCWLGLFWFIPHGQVLSRQGSGKQKQRNFFN